MAKHLTKGEIDGLKAGLDLVAEVSRYLPLKKHGREYFGSCPFHAERTASFTVNPEKGFFHCFGCGAHGDVYAFKMRMDGITFPEAVARLNEGYSETVGNGCRRVLPTFDHAKQEAEDEKMRQWALHIFEQECRPAAETPVETYLREARGIDLARIGGVPRVLKYHPALKHKDTGSLLPAMVAQVQDADGRFLGIQRTYLRMDGRGKAGVLKPKMAAGRTKGGTVRLRSARLDDPAAKVGLTEGIEEALTLMMMEKFPIWSAGGTEMLAAVRLPKEIRAVCLFGNNDRSTDEFPEGAGRHFVAEAALRFRDEGRYVTTAFPSDGFKDFNDEWRDSLKGCAL